MRIKISLLLGLWMLVAVNALAQQANPEQIDTLIAQQMERYKVPGMGFALILKGRVVYSKGYGVRDINNKTPVNTDTLFAVGSIAKTFTSLAMVQQVAANRLRLDVPVVQYLPSLKFSDPQKGGKVTLRHLLSNASGLARYDAWVFDPRFDTAQKIIETIEQIPFSSEPGTAFDYNNQNFIIAGAVLERISGKPWAEYVRQNIFRPLGLNRAQITFDEAVKAGNYAAPHSFTAKGLEAVPPFDRFNAIAPAGGIHASVNDLARFLQFQLNPKQTLLPKALWSEMHRQQVSSGAFDATQPTPLNDIRGYGLGWFLGEYRGLKGFAHGGNINGFTSMIFALPEKELGMVLLTNLNQANDFLDTTRLMLLEQIFDLQPRTDYSQIPAAQMSIALSQGAIFVPDSALKPLAGRYSLIGGGSLELVWSDGSLFLVQFGMQIPIAALSQNLFLAELAGQFMVMEFQTDSSGVVWIKQNGQLAGVKAPNPSP